MILRNFIFFCGFIACTSLATPLLAQSDAPPPVIWGSVSPTDLAMTSFKEDTSASAVILCDYGETRMNNDAGMDYTRHIRIKILKASGYDWGSHVVTVAGDDDVEQFKDLEGITYTPGSDGSVVATKLDNETVFKEDVDGERVRYHFTMPAMRPGCIIEFRYTIVSSGIFWMRGWKFQASIPVLWSEYRVHVPEEIKYAMVIRSLEPFCIDTKSETTRTYGGKTARLLGGPWSTCINYRWAMKNLRALREEPFITTVEDYCARIDFQLAEYRQPYFGVVSLLKTWDDLVEGITQSSSFREQFEPSSTICKLVEELTAGQTTPEGKAAALYSYVRNTFVCSGGGGGSEEEGFDEMLETKRGSVSDMAYLLITMLRTAGIQAHPVVVSTRENGKIQDLFPILTQFNHTLVLATIGSKEMFLDPTDRLRPMHLPPISVLNVRGLVLASGPVRFVKISSQYYAATTCSVTVTLDGSGGLRGTLETVLKDYGGVLVRHQLNEKSESEAAKAFFDADRLGLSVDSVALQGKDSVDQPLRIKAWVTSSSYTQVADGRIYINPFIVDREFSNPFTREERKFPVDMAYLWRTDSDIHITIPDGYEVEELPKDRTWAADRGKIAFSRKISVEKNIITLHTMKETRQVEFEPTVYWELRKFYGEMVAAQAEQVVLKRTPTSLSQQKK